MLQILITETIDLLMLPEKEEGYFTWALPTWPHPLAQGQDLFDLIDRSHYGSWKTQKD